MTEASSLGKSAAMMAIEVAYAEPESQMIVRLALAVGTTAEQAVEKSGLLARYADIDVAANGLGIFGKMIKNDQILQGGDRVEIYRPLTCDPKEVRARRANDKRRKERQARDERALDVKKEKAEKRAAHKKANDSASDSD